MRLYKTYGAAKRKAGGSPILAVGTHYLVGIDAFTGVSVVDTDNGHITGNIQLRHLDRLGNANYAKAVKPRNVHAFFNKARPLSNDQLDSKFCE